MQVLHYNDISRFPVYDNLLGKGIDLGTLPIEIYGYEVEVDEPLSDRWPNASKDFMGMVIKRRPYYDICLNGIQDSRRTKTDIKCTEEVVIQIAIVLNEIINGPIEKVPLYINDKYLSGFAYERLKGEACSNKVEFFTEDTI